MFAGIGGFREGLCRAGGFECVGHCERDEHAERSYRALFDTRGEWFCEDIRKADAGSLPAFELLCGGFPCQSFSIAGSRHGFADPRGTLFFELARVAEARKPQYLLFENVPGLLSHDGGRTFATILNTLDRLGYTQRNEGKFVIVESRAPSGYYGDWTDVTKPGTAGSVLGKRAYAFEITKALDGQTIWLGNADYNADITTANSGGTLIDTGEGVVTITFGSRNADKTYATDPTGIANNEDSYTMHANAGKMQNDRVLGNILLTKVDLDAARYLAAGSNGDTTLEGAVYDLYAANTIEHPDGVSGVVDYSKITDASRTPIWHTTVLTNGGWDTDYLPILQKDRLVASAKITDGKLVFANLYMGRYYLVERATGLVLPIDGNGKLYITGKYPQLNKKLERTGKYSDLARKNNEYTDYIYKNQYSAVAESRKLNGSKAWDGYYLSYAKGYLCDEVNHYKTLSYADESTYHIHAEQESQDEVIKSGFSLNKLVSTTGQPSPALKLEGAGFTVYRISKLSKAAQFKQNPDGSYDAASILSAYRKDNYDSYGHPVRRGAWQQALRLSDRGAERTSAR